MCWLWLSTKQCVGCGLRAAYSWTGCGCVCDLFVGWVEVGLRSQSEVSTLCSESAVTRTPADTQALIGVCVHVVVPVSAGGWVLSRQGVCCCTVLQAAGRQRWHMPLQQVRGVLKTALLLLVCCQHTDCTLPSITSSLIKQPCANDLLLQNLLQSVECPSCVCRRQRWSVACLGRARPGCGSCSRWVYWLCSVFCSKA